MATEADRKALTKAIVNKSFSKIRELLQRDDAKELLLMKDDVGYLPIHKACDVKLDSKALQPILDAAVEHGIIKNMLESKDDLYGRTCLHYALVNQSSTESPCVLLEYLSKYTDITKMLEEKDNLDQTRLHHACRWNIYAHTTRLLISFFPSKDMFENALHTKDKENKTPVDTAEPYMIKPVLQDSDCFQQCRLWLLQNHESTFICSLFPTSFDKTCQTLLELNNGLSHSQQHATIILIALMSSPSKFRKAIEKTESSAPMTSYFDVVKKGDAKSDYNHWRKNFNRFREFYGRWPPSDRKTKTSFEDEGSSSCVIQ